MHASRLCWSAAALILLAGLFWGIFMAASHDHTTASAHAHLNLTGWVTLALYGTYYALSGAGVTRIALVQSVIAILGSVVLSTGVAIVVTGGTDIPAVIGAFIILAAALLFAWIVFTKQLRPAAA